MKINFNTKNHSKTSVRNRSMYASLQGSIAGTNAKFPSQYVGYYNITFTYLHNIVQQKLWQKVCKPTRIFAVFSCQQRTEFVIVLDFRLIKYMGKYNSTITAFLEKDSSSPKDKGSIVKISPNLSYLERVSENFSIFRQNLQNTLHSFFKRAYLVSENKSPVF